MVTSNYDINVQLALATTAELEGDFVSALEFLQDAERLAREEFRAREWSEALRTLLFSALVI
ncbi:hypothetical protein BH11MYX2_BH11MYX2_08230 [soil metagenome]